MAARRSPIISIRLSAGTAGFVAEMDKSGAKVVEFGRTVDRVGHSSVSNVQATSAALRVMEGSWSNNLRASERFLANVLGLGPILQKAFPIIGGIAFLGLLAKLGTELYDFFKKIQESPRRISEAFRGLNDPLMTANDELRLSIDKTLVEIDRMQGRHPNLVALEMDEGRVAADKLAEAIGRATKALEEYLEKEGVGRIAGFFTGRASTFGDTEEVKHQQERLNRIEEERAAALNALDEKRAAGASVASIAKAQDAVEAAVATRRKDELRSEIELFKQRRRATIESVVSKPYEPSRRERDIAAISGQGTIGPTNAAAPHDITEQAKIEAGIITNRTLLLRRANEEEQSAAAKKQKTQLESDAKDAEYAKILGDRLIKLQAMIDAAKAKAGAAGLGKIGEIIAKGYGSAQEAIESINKRLESLKPLLGPDQLSALGKAQITAKEQTLAMAEAQAQWRNKLAETVTQLRAQTAEQNLLTAAIGRGYAATKAATVAAQATKDTAKESGLVTPAQEARLTSAADTAYEAQQVRQAAAEEDSLRTQIDGQRMLAAAQLQGASAAREATLAHKLDQVALDSVRSYVTRLSAAYTELDRIERVNIANQSLFHVDERISDIRRLTSAILQGAEAERRAALESKYAQMLASGGDTGENREVIRRTREADILERRLQITRSATKTGSENFDRLRELEAELSVLNEIKASGQGTLETEISLREVRRETLETIVKYQLQIGSASSGVRAFFVEMQEEGKRAGQVIYESLRRATDGVADTLSKIASGQIQRTKGDQHPYERAFGELAKGLGGDLLKNSITNALHEGLGALGKLFPSISGLTDRLTKSRADGSESSPFWVRIVGGLGLPSPRAADLPTVPGTGISGVPGTGVVLPPPFGSTAAARSLAIGGTPPFLPGSPGLPGLPGTLGLPGTPGAAGGSASSTASISEGRLGTIGTVLSRILLGPGGVTEPARSTEVPARRGASGYPTLPGGLVNRTGKSAEELGFPPAVSTVESTGGPASPTPPVSIPGAAGSPGLPGLPALPFALPALPLFTPPGAPRVFTPPEPPVVAPATPPFLPAPPVAAAVPGAVSATAAAAAIPASITAVLKTILGGLPGFADGGTVTKPTLAWIGEGGEPEVVVPRSKVGPEAFSAISDMVAGRGHDGLTGAAGAAGVGGSGGAGGVSGAGGAGGSTGSTGPTGPIGRTADLFRSTLSGEPQRLGLPLTAAPPQLPPLSNAQSISAINTFARGTGQFLELAGVAAGPAAPLVIGAGVMLDRASRPDFGSTTDVKAEVPLGIPRLGAAAGTAATTAAGTTSRELSVFTPASESTVSTVIRPAATISSEIQNIKPLPGETPAAMLQRGTTLLREYSKSLSVDRRLSTIDVRRNLQVSSDRLRQSRTEFQNSVVSSLERTEALKNSLRTESSVKADEGLRKFREDTTASIAAARAKVAGFGPAPAAAATPSSPAPSPASAPSPTSSVAVGVGGAGGAGGTGGAAGAAGAAGRAGAASSSAPVVLQDFVHGRGGFADPARLVIRSGRDVEVEDIRKEFFSDYNSDRLSIEKFSSDSFLSAVQPGRQSFRLQFMEKGRHVSTPAGVEERLGLRTGESYHGPTPISPVSPAPATPAISVSAPAAPAAPAAAISAPAPRALAAPRTAAGPTVYVSTEAPPNIGTEPIVYRAGGGPLQPNQHALVGERGRELFLPDSAVKDVQRQAGVPLHQIGVEGLAKGIPQIVGARGPSFIRPTEPGHVLTNAYTDKVISQQSHQKDSHQKDSMASSVSSASSASSSSASMFRSSMASATNKSSRMDSRLENRTNRTSRTNNWTNKQTEYRTAQGGAFDDILKAILTGRAAPSGGVNAIPGVSVFGSDTTGFTGQSQSSTGATLAAMLTNVGITSISKAGGRGSALSTLGPLLQVARTAAAIRQASAPSIVGGPPMTGREGALQPPVSSPISSPVSSPISTSTPISPPIATATTYARTNESTDASTDASTYAATNAIDNSTRSSASSSPLFSNPFSRQPSFPVSPPSTTLGPATPPSIASAPTGTESNPIYSKSVPTGTETANPDGTPQKPLWTRSAQPAPQEPGAVSTIFSILGSLVSASAGPISAGAGGGARASGGPISAGSAYIAGEYGPEVIEGVSGYVHDASQSRSMLVGGGGDMHLYTIDARGTDPGLVGMHVQHAIEKSQEHAVSTSVRAVQDRSRRTVRSK